MEVAANCSLRVKRPLLDPRFEGYKLSLEPLPCYQLELDAGGKRRRPLALCSFHLLAVFVPTLPSFSSFLTRASKATEDFLTARRAGVDTGWGSLEKDAYPGTTWELTSCGSYVAGYRDSPRLDSPGSEVWALAACQSLEKAQNLSLALSTISPLLCIFCKLVL